MKKANDIVDRMIESAGHFTQSAGVGRALGQIFAYIYFSPDPQSLDSITSALGISKGSASVGVRQLERWGALRKIPVKGDRKDYYQAEDTLGRIIKNMFRDTIGKRMENSLALFEHTEQELDSTETGNDGNGKFTLDQIDKLRGFKDRTVWMWDNVISKILDRQTSVAESTESTKKLLFDE